MDQQNGWIKLHRKMLDNPIVMKDSDHLAVWVFLLLHATHKDYPALFRGKRITLHPGQLLTGRKAIANALDIPESKAKRILYEFENDHQIGRQTSNKNSLITIYKWDLYQDCGQQNGQQMDSKWTASGQQVDTNKNERIKEYKNINNNHSFNDTVLESENVENFVENYSCDSVVHQDDDYQSKLEVWNQRVIKALKNNDDEAVKRAVSTANALGFYIDIDDLKRRM